MALGIGAIGSFGPALLVAGFPPPFDVSIELTEAGRGFLGGSPFVQLFLAMGFVFYSYVCGIALMITGAGVRKSLFPSNDALRIARVANLHNEVITRVFFEARANSNGFDGLAMAIPVVLVCLSMLLGSNVSFLPAAITAVFAPIVAWSLLRYAAKLLAEFDNAVALIGEGEVSSHSH